MKTPETTEETGGAVETQTEVLVRKVRLLCETPSTYLNNLSRRVLNLKRKLKTKKALPDKDFRWLLKILVSEVD